MMEDASEKPFIIQAEMKWPLFVPIVAGIFLILYVMLHYVGKINIQLILIISMVVMIMDILSIYVTRKNKIMLNNDSISIYVPFKNAITIYYDSISKIEYKKASSFFMIYEKFPNKPSVLINSRVYSAKDLNSVLHRVIAHKPKIKLDEETRNILER